MNDEAFGVYVTKFRFVDSFCDVIFQLYTAIRMKSVKVDM